MEIIVELKEDPKEQELPKVVITVINWNSWDDIKNCVESIRRSTYKKYDILIVDNASTDDSLKRIVEAYPGLKIIEHKENLGPIAANNSGFCYAHADHHQVYDGQ